ncbi:YciI family protein [Streptosporangium sp. NPDC048047]|uniref:YciI family protein n=1 Tax=Streptosporangium sp. NPDC048047 TaxID=3155748 RepID=UPI00341BF336
MKYMIMLYGSQRDYDTLSGKDSGDRPGWTAEEVAAMHEFMGAWNAELAESGEFVDARGLSAPVHARRVELRDGVPVVTDGPYAETQEVIAGYTIVECASFDRATEIAARLARTPAPEGATLDHAWYVDVRPLDDGPGEFDA